MPSVFSIDGPVLLRMTTKSEVPGPTLFVLHRSDVDYCAVDRDVSRCCDPVEQLLLVDLLVCNSEHAVRTQHIDVHIGVAILVRTDLEVHNTGNAGVVILHINRRGLDELMSSTAEGVGNAISCGSEGSEIGLRVDICPHIINSLAAVFWYCSRVSVLCFCFECC